jgi:hypothetical protein
MFFTPDTFLPGKKVLITVHAGRHSHTFSFTTADQADAKVDLYRAVLKTYFRAPQNTHSPDIVALDTTYLNQLTDAEQQLVAKGIYAYASPVQFGTKDEGFRNIDGMIERTIDEEADVLYLTPELLQQKEGQSLIVIKAQRGKGILQGQPGTSFSVTYQAVYQAGKWEIHPAEQESPLRPWG